MIFFGVWVLSLIATIYLADQKKLSMFGFVILAIATGPLAVIIALISNDRSAAPSRQSSQPQESSLEAELLELKRIQKNLNVRLGLLEEKLNMTSPDVSECPSPVVQMDVPSNKVLAVAEENREKNLPLDMEMILGRNWLNKIGIVIFTLGMGFLISYSFKYFGPFIKIALGYIVSGILFYAGIRFENEEKLKPFSRALFGGAWALVYFTTYAMHHFAASRLIESQTLDLLLLSGVALGMISHASRFQSEAMMSMALFVAFFTTTMGEVSIFTLLSTVVLGVLILYLVHRFQWTKILALGVILTYGFHVLWVLPKLRVAESDMMNFIFLSCYAVIYFLGVHLLRLQNEEKNKNEILAINGGNIGLYLILAYGLITDLFCYHRFEIALGIGLLFLFSGIMMKFLGRRSLYLSDIISAVAVLTYAVCLKFVPSIRILVWLIETPLLLFISVSYQERIYRLLSYAVAALTAAAILFWYPLWNWGWGGSFDHNLSKKVILGCAAVSMALCCYIMQIARQEKKFEKEGELFFDHAFSALSFGYGTWFLILVIKYPWAVLGGMLEGLALVMVSILTSMPRFRYYAYLLWGLSLVGICCESFFELSKIQVWFIYLTGIACLVTSYWLVRMLKESSLVFWAAVILTTTMIFKLFHPAWITLMLGGIGVGVILVGMLSQDKTVRLGGMAFLVMTLDRIIFIEIAGLDIIFKIITLIGIGLLFLGISFLYNRNQVLNKKN